MPIVMLNHKKYTCPTTENVLESLNKQGACLPFGCGGGACHTCMVKLLEGEIPALAQAGLQDTQKAQGYFLPCMCKPISDLHIAPQQGELSLFKSTVLNTCKLNETFTRLRLLKPIGFSYFSGQFIQLEHHGHQRKYALISLNSEDFLELHVQQLDDDMSRWLTQDLHEGDHLSVSTAQGDCFYLTNTQPLLLVATGATLAPLYAVLRNAIAAKHAAPISIFYIAPYHNSSDHDAILQAISDQHQSVTYYPCMFNQGEGDKEEQAAIYRLFATHHDDFQNWRVFLWANTGMLNQLRLLCLQKKVRLQDVYATDC